MRNERGALVAQMTNSHFLDVNLQQLLAYFIKAQN